MSDIELHHSDSDAGSPALFFVHGFSSGLEDWDPQVAHFSQRHRVIAPALRGHGRSPRGTGDMSMPQLAEDCVALARAKGVTSMVVAGHSMGTRIALDMRRQAPDLVTGLILVDGSNTAGAGKDAALAGFNKGVEEHGYAPFARGLFEAMFFDAKHDALKAKLVARALSVPETTAGPLYRNMIQWDGDEAQAVMQSAKVPILVLQSTTRGADNMRRTLAAGETGAYEALVTKNAPHADIVAMPGLGHFITIEAPDQVNAEMDAWLDKHGLRG